MIFLNILITSLNIVICFHYIKGNFREKEESLARQKAELTALREKLNSLASAEAALIACQSRERQAAERLEALAGLQREISAIDALEAKLTEEKESLLRLTQRAGESAARADALYQSFIAAQAAVLADELRQTLEISEEANLLLRAQT